MKKMIAACLLLALLMLTLVSCTDDFVFIDKSKDNESGENETPNNPSGGENNPSGGENPSGGGNSSGGSNGGGTQDQYYKDGWGGEIPLS